MDIKKLVRNPESVAASLKQMGKTFVATKPTRITVPASFERKGLVELGAEPYIVGIYGIIVGNEYACSVVPAMMRTDPSVVSQINIDDTDYLAFDYEPGAAVVANTDLVRYEKLIYNVFDHIVAGGKVPWNMNYDDMGGILDYAAEFANSRIGDNHEMLELLISILARDPENPNFEYRHTLKSFEQLVKRPPYFSPLRSVRIVATNVTSKLGGSNYSEGMISSLVNPSTKTERIEDYLRI